MLVLHLIAETAHKSILLGSYRCEALNVAHCRVVASRCSLTELEECATTHVPLRHDLGRGWLRIRTINYQD